MAIDIRSIDEFRADEAGQLAVQCIDRLSRNLARVDSLRTLAAREACRARDCLRIDIANDASPRVLEADTVKGNAAAYVLSAQPGLAS